MTRLVYFSSVSGNTKRFVEKLEMPARRIPLYPKDEPLIVEVGGEQLGMPRREAPVASDVHVPPGLRGDHADVLRPGLRAFARATRDTDLQLVRCAESAVAQLEAHGHPHGIQNAVPAPG